MRFLWTLFKLGVFIAIVGFFMKTYGAKWLLTVYLQKELGTRVSVEEVKLDFVNSQAKFSRLVIQNPLVFPEGGMLFVPKLFLDFELKGLLNGKIKLKTLDINVGEVRVLNVPGNGINLYALSVMKPKYKDTGETGAARFEVESAPQFYADQVILSLGQGTYTDLMGANPLQKSHELKLQHGVFRNVEGLRGVMDLVIWETLKRMGISAPGA